MARIERKLHYVGTWREDHVTDTTMRHIIARSAAEKGQKVKVRLSREGLKVSRTVLFQENFLSAFPLQDVYFLTVNPHHPTCLLCIVADPVKKYLILVLRTSDPEESKEMIVAFQRLKDLPPAHSGNVVLRRKDNGNWTLRERSQHNANRHLQQAFREASSSSTAGSPAEGDPATPNGHALPPPSPFFDAGTLTERGDDAVDGGGEGGGGGGGGGGGVRRRAHSASQTAMMAPAAGEGSEEEMALMRLEVEHLTQELRDLKLVLEQVGTLRPSPRHNNNNNSTTTTNANTTTTNNNNNKLPTSTTSEKTSSATATVSHTSSGVLVRAISNGGAGASSSSSSGGVGGSPRHGEARVYVEDHRMDPGGRGGARSAPPHNKPLFGNVRVQRQIAVPEPSSSSSSSPPIPPQAVNGYHHHQQQQQHVPDPTPFRTLQRHAQPPAPQPPQPQPAVHVSRKPSASQSLFQTRARGGGGGGATTRRAHDPHQYYFRSMRISRTSGVPSTIARPIEDIYRPGSGHTLRRAHGPVFLVQEPAMDVYISQQQQQQQQQQYQQQQQQSGVAYVQVHRDGIPSPSSSLRRPRSAASSARGWGHGGEVRGVSADGGELDDVLL